MMKYKLNFYLTNIEYEIKFSSIDDFDRFEERFFEIERFFGDIVGMGINFVEFCPNNNPPILKDELLPWIWLIHPNLHKEICAIASKELNELIHDYNNSQMNTLNINNMGSIKSLIEQFSQSAINHYEYTQDGNWRKGNAEIERINKIYEFIKKQEGMEELLKLIYSDIPAVVSLAATYCMRYNPEECLAVMDELSKKNIPFISMGAEYAIKNWENGNWNIG